MPERSAKIRERLFEVIHNGEINNGDLVQIFEHIGIILNLQTISNYAKSEKISYNGALKRKTEKVTINSVEFIINND
jgi:hypothetical protein